MKNKPQHILMSVLLCIILSCTPKISENLPIPDLEGQGPIEEELTIENESLETFSTDTVPKANPVIIGAALNGLELIEDRWDQTILFQDTTIKFLMVRLTSRKTVVAIASGHSTAGELSSDFYFYEIDLKGVVLSNTPLYSSDYSCILDQNLQEFQNSIRYFRKRNMQEEWVYDLETKKHSKTELKQLDWETINDWKKQDYFLSPDKSRAISLEGTHLSLLEGEKKVKLISQLYDGTWSFGFGCWGTDGNTFYFDNSGATACIWKIDLKAKTLAKIVPEHEASCPSAFEENGQLKILYCEESFIKLASP